MIDNSEFKILVVDDEIFNVEVVIGLLEDDGYQLEYSTHPLEALKKIYDNDFDLLLLDINVPYINGFELLKGLRDDYIDTPAIFITANIDIDSLKQGFDVGADDYIKKPFDFVELLIRIDALLKKTTPPKIIYNNLILDTDSKTLKKDNKTIHLTPSEMAIFEYFITNQGRVIESFELLEVSNTQEFKTEILRVWISKLKKIGLNITNIRGIGYRCEKI